MFNRNAYPILVTLAALLLTPACAPKYPNCKNDSHCKEGEFCINNLCQQCRTDDDCPGNEICNSGRCEVQDTGGIPCKVDADCPENHECKDGRCVAPPTEARAPSPCGLHTVYFGYDTSTLSSDAISKLKDTASCLKKAAGRKHRLEGHCDPRGTVEYNIALGDARARSVQTYLTRLGVKDLRTVSKGELEATGTSETGWARDRKVVPLAD